MKGVVFTEFLGFVELTWNLDMVDDIIEACDLPSGGAYTAVGTYDHSEIASLIQALGEKVDIPISDLLKIFGKYLFGRFAIFYPQFFEETTSALDFLVQVENYIHVEVKKLYPDAMLPSFDTIRTAPGSLEMIYRSERHFQDLALGLIEGCCDYFNEPCEITMHPPAEDESVLFVITRE